MNDDLEWLREVPIAHRALHDTNNGRVNGRVENSLAAVCAAIQNGYSIEVDLQLTKDKNLVVFHDFILDRLTCESGNVRDYTMAQLRKFKLEDTQEYIPSLDELLTLVAGQVGIVLELKGIEGMDSGYLDTLNKSIEKYLAKYSGQIAVMSFDHWLLKDARLTACPCPIGLTAQGDDSFYQAHQKIADDLNVDFISYGIDDIPCKFATKFKKTGKPVICWTVRNTAAWKQVLIYTDQITFEGFDPK